MTVTEINESTQVMTVHALYSHLGDEGAVVESVLTALAGADGATGPTGPTGPTGATGASGADQLTVRLSTPAVTLTTYANGGMVASINSIAYGYATVWSGNTDVTASAVFTSSDAGCTGTVNTSDYTPVQGQPKGFYQVTELSATCATLTITATYDGNSADAVFAVGVNTVGYEIARRLDRDFSVYPYPTVDMPPYLLLDAALTADLGRQFAVFFRVDNILDTPYETVWGYGAPGRSARLGFRLTI